MRPLERLDTKRMGSMSSTVGPAVTRTFWPSRSRRRSSIAMAAATISAGSAKRPFPSHPHARYPDPGSTKRTPRRRSVSMFSITAGCSNMLTFMAGATRTGARVAVYSVDSESSAMPRANLPSVFAVAGATSSRFAASASPTCRISPSMPSSNWSRKTGCRESASKVIGDTKRVAFWVMTTWTSTPRFCSSRSTSQAFYAPMQPVTPSTTVGMRAGNLLRLGRHRWLGHVVRHLPGHGPRQHLLHRDAGRLAAPRLDARLGPDLELLRPLGRHGDEPKLAIHVFRKDQVVRHCLVLSSLVGKGFQDPPRIASHAAGAAARGADHALQRLDAAVEVVVDEDVVVLPEQDRLLGGGLEPTGHDGLAHGAAPVKAALQRL